MFVDAARVPLKKPVALALHDNIMRVIVRPDIFLALAAETTPPPRAPVPQPCADAPSGPDPVLLPTPRFLQSSRDRNLCNGKELPSLPVLLQYNVVCLGGRYAPYQYNNQTLGLRLIE